MNQVLSGQSTFVTGGGSGIGLACAKAFAADGSNVLIMGRTEDKLIAAVSEIEAMNVTGKIQYFSGDVAKEEDVAEAVEQATVEGTLDICIANAGMGGIAPIMVTEGKNWDEIMQTNLNGTFYSVKLSAQKMAKSGGGAICAISSIAGVRTHRFMGPYCVSKAGIDMLIRNSADELGIANIRVNSVCPGLVETELASGLLNTEAVYNDYLACMPISRHGVVEDISSAVRFLCGPESSWITGVVLSVDGGHHLRRGPNYEPFIRPMFGDDIAEGRLP
jgi:NAD(P)-dependent dehydrogenase (short-subunit alcohol dehydrogenase family)